MKRNFLYNLILLAISAEALLGIALADEKAASQKNIKAVVEGNNRFAFDLYKKLVTHPDAQKQDGNLFFSPYSISTALAMTYAGARGETQKQMAEVLHFSLPQDCLHPALGVLQRQLNSGGEKGGYQLRVANALWGQKGYGFLQEFIKLTEKNYGAGLWEVDFINETEKARRNINAWVERKTEDKIKELIKKGILGGDTVLVLTNAIYFKGDWQVQFDKKDTKESQFMISAKNKVKVPMMYLKEDFNYCSDENLQVLELPYKGEHLSMIVLLPKQIGGLQRIEQLLTPGNLNIWLQKLHKQEIIVYLPKFKMTWGAFELKDILIDMGMPAAFIDADFSGISGNRELFISNVLHKAFVEVNEQGTEAAAATAVAMKATSIGPVFRADHPFIFLIKDNQSGSILFTGRVMNPAGQ
ncbi:MAG: serpin family protein [Sedimentisphaerales bacterium]|nr:serpin family protein [Sedimentisphaerales bacterium]